MKRILITGKNSYIGTNVEKWLMKTPEQYHVDTLDVKDQNWKEFDFSSYDVVFHVAGIAHVKETKTTKPLYFKVNCELAIQVAEKAKSEGVKQFIFMSTMSVYGLETGVINRNTLPNPKSLYGKSKYEAEKALQKYSHSHFKVAILRPPMVYGRGCKGNYEKLAKFAKYSPIFPHVHNQRSMIYIDNLSIYLEYLIANELEGLFFPQNKEFVNTSSMVEIIRCLHGKKVILSKFLGRLVQSINHVTLHKVFKDLIYTFNEDEVSSKLNLINFTKSIKETEYS